MFIKIKSLNEDLLTGEITLMITVDDTKYDERDEGTWDDIKNLNKMLENKSKLWLRECS